MAFLGSADHHVRCGRQEVIDEMRTIQKSVKSYLPPRYLRTPEAARFVGLSIRTLEKHRIYGTGPRYSKLGGRVVYRVEDLQAWVESGAKASTSDPGTATVLPAKRQAVGLPARVLSGRR